MQLAQTPRMERLVLAHILISVHLLRQHSAEMVVEVDIPLQFRRADIPAVVVPTLTPPIQQQRIQIPEVVALVSMAELVAPMVALVVVALAELAIAQATALD